MAQNQFGKQVKIVRTDNGSEFKFGSMKIFHHEKGDYTSNRLLGYSSTKWKSRTQVSTYP